MRCPNGIPTFGNFMVAAMASLGFLPDLKNFGDRGSPVSGIIEFLRIRLSCKRGGKTERESFRRDLDRRLSCKNKVEMASIRSRRSMSRNPNTLLLP
jgi:hypothetical protein